MDFLNFFNLKEDPFKLTPDPVYFFPSSSHNEGLLTLEYSIDQKEGFNLIIGDPGTGKTTLLRVFLDKLKSSAQIAMILTPRLSPEEFLIAVAEDFSINLKEKNKNEIIKALRDFMTQKSSEGKRVIIIVDEAQNLPDETLEELRLLSNLETDKDKLLQIILIGQPELEVKLKKDKLRQLNQRITSRLYLKQFNANETLDYINYRVIKGGGSNLRFCKRADRLIYKLTKGTPRLINMLASRALMAAYLEESNSIDKKHVKHAIRSLNHSDLKIHWRYRLMPAGIGLLAASLIMACVYMFTIMASGEDSKASYKPSASFTATSPLSAPVPVPVPVPEKKKVRNTPEAPASQDAVVLKRVSIVPDIVNIRMNPSLDAEKAGWTLKGYRFNVLNEVMDEDERVWYQIYFKGKKRWISAKVVTKVDSDTEHQGI
jgi:general secretion pathway protein A